MKRLFFIILASLLSLISHAQNIDSLLVSGKEKMQRRDLLGAVADFSKVIEKDSTIEDAYFNRAAAYYELFKLEEALIDLDICLQLDPGSSTVYWLRGSVKNLRGLPKYALVDLNIAIQLQPDNGQIYYERCIARFKIGDKEGACDDLATAKLMGEEMTTFWKVRLKKIKCD